MIIMPVPVSHEPDRCPKCMRPEDVKQMCRYCQYEYVEEDGMPVIFGWLILVFVLGGAALGYLYAERISPWPVGIFDYGIFVFFGGVLGLVTLFIGVFVTAFFSWLISETFSS